MPIFHKVNQSFIDRHLQNGLPIDSGLSSFKPRTVKIMRCANVTDQPCISVVSHMMLHLLGCGTRMVTFTLPVANDVDLVRVVTELSLQKIDKFGHEGTGKSGVCDALHEG
jgi:hypothetical protein